MKIKRFLSHLFLLLLFFHLLLLSHLLLLQIYIFFKGTVAGQDLPESDTVPLDSFRLGHGPLYDIFTNFHFDLVPVLYKIYLITNFLIARSAGLPISKPAEKKWVL
jgi:hypothetical protein